MNTMFSAFPLKKLLNVTVYPANTNRFIWKIYTGISVPLNALNSYHILIMLRIPEENIIFYHCNMKISENTNLMVIKCIRIH